MDYQIQLDYEQRRVWVHASDGSTVARFDARAGIDIHRTVTEQMAGAPQCLHCTHTTPTAADWADFRSRVKSLWDVDIPQDAVDEQKFFSKKWR